MNITEDEARNKLCVGPKTCGKMILVNADANPPFAECELWERRCVASKCMAWERSEAFTSTGSCGFVRNTP